MATIPVGRMAGQDPPYGLASLVDELSYRAMRVSRVNGGNDETIFRVADGVPTSVRILQRENGEDGIDLRLTEYRGAE